MTRAGFRVDPALRGRGYGRALLDFALAELRAGGFQEAYVLTTTIPAWLSRLDSPELQGACPKSARVFGLQL